MKTPFRYALLAAFVGVLAFGLTYVWLRPSGGGDEMAWLQKEFALTPAQLAAIERLHDDYRPVCLEHCKLVAQAHERLAQAAGPEAKSQAQANLARLETVCREATQDHLNRVAAEMSPPQGTRFLELMAPRISGHRHLQPLGLK